MKAPFNLCTHIHWCMSLSARLWQPRVVILKSLEYALQVFVKSPEWWCATCYFPCPQSLCNLHVHVQCTRIHDQWLHDKYLIHVRYSNSCLIMHRCTIYSRNSNQHFDCLHCTSVAWLASTPSSPRISLTIPACSYSQAISNGVYPFYNESCIHLCRELHTKSGRRLVTNLSDRRHHAFTVNYFSLLLKYPLQSFQVPSSTCTV